MQYFKELFYFYAIILKLKKSTLKRTKNGK